MGRIALVAGATGHVGSCCVDLLLKDEHYSRVLVLVRRLIPYSHPKLRQIIVDYDNLARSTDEMVADDVFICLGTTNADSPDRDLYYKVDVQYPTDVAAAARLNGASTVCIITAVGANSKSRQWYLRFKGEVEEKIVALGYRTTALFRPSLIDGRRSEARLKERLALATIKFWSFLFVGRGRRFLPIHRALIAAAMIVVAKQSKPGAWYLDRIEMLDLLGFPN